MRCAFEQKTDRFASILVEIPVKIPQSLASNRLRRGTRRNIWETLRKDACGRASNAVTRSSYAPAPPPHPPPGIAWGAVSTVLRVFGGRKPVVPRIWSFVPSFQPSILDTRSKKCSLPLKGPTPNLSNSHRPLKCPDGREVVGSAFPGSVCTLFYDAFV